VATTVAGAVAAHIASEQHARISASYAVTVERLGSLIRGFHAEAADAEAATAFVAGVEEVLAQQNQLWVSTLTARP
jgi:osmotically-inducible protein OsmY